VEFDDRDLDHVQIEILFRPISRPAQHPEQRGTGAPRRSERPDRPFGPRPSEPGRNRLPVAPRSTPPASPIPGVPRPVPGLGSVSAPTAIPPRPAQVAVPAPPSPPAANNKPEVTPPAASSATPAPTSARTPPADTEVPARTIDKK
jgi:hypothetical protein